MDNRISDKDLEFVNGGAAATPELAVVLNLLRRAEHLFTDDMPEVPRNIISSAITSLNHGLDITFTLEHNIPTVIDEFNTFKDTLLPEDADMRGLVANIIHYLSSALNHLNH